VSNEPMSDTLRAQIAEILDRAETELLRTVTQGQGRSFGREALDRELRDVRDAVLRMGTTVEDAIERSVKALSENDVPLAETVITGDLHINEMQRQVSALITTTIATQQPVARDLRFLLALDHVGYELERIGDHAKSVAKHARTLAGEPQLRSYVPMPEIGALAVQQLHAILRALVDVDEVAAREVAAVDDEIDARYHAAFAQLLDLMRADGANVDRGTHLLLVAHDLERIGDRVTNIAEDVVFLARGEIEDLNP
jgi:phosphate transport system protein